MCYVFFLRYGTMYRTAIQEYKASYFRERSSLSLFTRYMIAIINNCDRFEELSQNMKARWWKSGHHEAEGAGKFEMLLKTFQEIRQESVHYLLDEAFLDIESYFSDLITPKWQSGSQAVDTICITLNDYFEDYQFLKKSNFELVINCAQDRVARKYIAAMLQVHFKLLLMLHCCSKHNFLEQLAEKEDHLHIRGRAESCRDKDQD